ncbi:trypsin-like serine peptidase [Streptomyces tropicalis]|uniref:Trypsin-like serine protease n=1 Tax=Streptomyces tropicalis TaxID=3034234 RepID=A0ABT5ZYA2_9ACTN|nr:trypsin-like serine protease [Streptomyces tropicalis]MDF3297369.1 trypsin-like serine protease [Streptomyces tropicalis]
MSSSSRWIPALAIGLCAGALGTGAAPAAPGATVPAASAASAVGAGVRGPAAVTAGSTALRSLRAEETYWTADRMARAVPADAAAPPPLRAGARHGPPAGTPAPEHFNGHPMVGTFFFDGRPLGGGSTYCTGSVVHTAAHDIVLTAGHCGRGLERATHRVFVPQYRYGRSAAAQPFGVFPVTTTYIDPRYTTNTRAATSDLDLAFARVGANGRGRVEDLTGALAFTPSTGYIRKVTVIGYPSSASVNPRHRAIRCPVTTTRLSGYRQMRMLCTGFYGGVSGGPWIEGYDRATGRGRLIGNTGGYLAGGDVDWVTYAPLYGKDAQALFADAAAHRPVGTRPPYHPAATTR